MTVSMALLLLITLANVAVRYLTHASFAFTEEISVALMVIMALAGASSAVARDRHIRVTVLIDRLPQRGRRAAELLALAATALMFGLLTWYGARLAYDDFRYEVTSPGLGLPQWLYSVWLPLLSALIAVRALGRALGLILRLLRRP